MTAQILKWCYLLGMQCEIDFGELKVTGDAWWRLSIKTRGYLVYTSTLKIPHPNKLPGLRKGCRGMKMSGNYATAAVPIPGKLCSSVCIRKLVVDQLKSDALGVALPTNTVTIN